MYPGPNDTDWQVATFQHREMVATGQHQQFVASALASARQPRVDRGYRSSTLQPRFETALLLIGKRLLCGRIAPGSVTSVERGAAV